jgi:hypothetical protein
MTAPDLQRPSPEFRELMTHLGSHHGSQTGRAGCPECGRLRESYHSDLRRRMRADAEAAQLRLDNS